MYFRQRIVQTQKWLLMWMVLNWIRILGREQLFSIHAPNRVWMPVWGNASGGSCPTFQPCTPHPGAQGRVPNWQRNHVEMWLWAQYRRFEQEILLPDFWLLFPHVTSLLLITLTHVGYASISLLNLRGCGSMTLKDCLMHCPSFHFPDKLVAWLLRNTKCVVS